MTKEFTFSNPERKKYDYKIGDDIICPSDLTDIVWKIMDIKDDGTIRAERNPNQNASKFYPEKIEITPKALNKWEKVE